MTCLDQVGDKVRFWHGDKARTEHVNRMADEASELIGGERLVSWGPTRDTLIHR